MKKICSRHCIQIHFIGNSTIKNLLVSPKDKEPMENKSRAICWYQYGDLACDEEYKERRLGPLEQVSKNTNRNNPIYIHIVIIQAIPPHRTTSK